MFKKLACILLSALLVLPIFGKTSFIFAEDEDYETEETYEEETSEEEVGGCIISGEHFSDDECAEMYADAKKRVKEIEAEIKAVEDSKEEKLALAEKYAAQAEGMQNDIDNLSKQIDELQNRIDELTTNIAQNEKLVDELNGRVKDRMVNAQKTMHFNGYLEFILGSKSFTDMLARIYGVEAVVSKDEADRKEYIEVIEQLNKDKVELDSAKQKLDLSFKDLVSKQESLKAMQELYEQEAARIQEELDRMTEERDNNYESFSSIASAIRDAGISVSTGFSPAVHNSWISSTVWNYSPDFLSGQWHLGVDYAASRYEKIHAPATGVIIRADDSCSDPGSLSSYCGEWIAGGGNQVYMMCEVDDVVYGFIFFHMNSISVSEGDLVLEDDVIGTVGSSGKSTGPHCHIEMYELYYGTLQEALEENWNVTFSVGRGETAYNNRCYYDSDGSRRQYAPCILNPEMYLPEN